MGSWSSRAARALSSAGLSGSWGSPFAVSSSAGMSTFPGASPVSTGPPGPAPGPSLERDPRRATGDKTRLPALVALASSESARPSLTTAWSTGDGVHDRVHALRRRFSRSHARLRTIVCIDERCGCHAHEETWMLTESLLSIHSFRSAFPGHPGAGRQTKRQRSDIRERPPTHECRSQAQHARSCLVRYATVTTSRNLLSGPIVLTSIPPGISTVLVPSR
jgi:hypothetical protein